MCSSDLNGTYMAADKRPFVMKMFKSTSMDDVPRMIEDMKKCKEAGAEYIVYSLHWGDEYNDKPDVGNRRQKDIAQALVEAGADIIMGNHAHTVHPIEKKTVTVDGREKEALIIYSLGNFFADQMALTDARVGTTQKHQDSMLVSVTIARDKDTGVIQMQNAEYMPTRTMVYQNNGKKAYQIIPIGKFAQMDFTQMDIVPAYFNTSDSIKRIKEAWDRVTSVVGDAIPATRG